MEVYHKIFDHVAEKKRRDEIRNPMSDMWWNTEYYLGYYMSYVGKGYRPVLRNRVRYDNLIHKLNNILDEN